MKKIKIIFTVMLLAGFGFSSKAQQESPYSFYAAEPTVLNPATMGENNNINAYIGYKKQWVGIEGAPQVTMGGINSLFNKNMGLGLSVMSRTSSVFKTFSSAASYSYRLFLGDDHYLSQGISLGMRKTSLDDAKIPAAEAGDPAHANAATLNKAFITAAYGISYHNKNLTVDVALPSLYSGETKKAGESFLAHTSYNFFTADNVWRIQPSVMFKTGAYEKSEWEVSFLTEYSKTLMLQLGYRTNKDVVIMMGLNYKNIGLMYAYEVTNSVLEKVSSGSHNLMLRIKLPYAIVK